MQATFLFQILVSKLLMSLPRDMKSDMTISYPRLVRKTPISCRCLEDGRWSCLCINDTNEHAVYF